MQGRQSSVQPDINSQHVANPVWAAESLEFIKSSQLFLLKYMGQISDDLSKYLN